MGTTIQFGGVVSGLNTQGIIDALVAVQKQPLTDLQTKEANLTARKTAYTQVGTAINDLIAKVKNFTVTSAGASRVAIPSDSSIFTATAATSSAVAQYQVSVDRLASSTVATSAASMGLPLVVGVDTSKTLVNARLATAITAGNMSLTVDGQTVQFTVGNPATTTLQSLMDGIAGALQSQIQAQGDTATVTASIVGNKLQLAVTGNGMAHDISFGIPGDTSNAAAALGLSTQGVIGVQDATFTGGYLDPSVASLNLPGSMTAGQISAVVDGQIVHYTVANPANTTFQQLMDGFSAAIQAQLRAGGANNAPDAGATVTTSVVGNKLQIAVGGGALAHSFRFGAAGDTSNALGLLGISNTVVAPATNPTITGTTNLGVTRSLGPLDGAGLSGLSSTKTGAITINGVDISYDTTADSLSTIISRINSSGAGVIASIDRTNDKLILTRKDTGALAIDMQDKSGNLLSTLKLAPGTTNSQVIGRTAQVTVDGRTITSSTNSVTNAIDGVTLNLVALSPGGQAQGLTIGVDQAAISTALNSLISSFNSLADGMDKLTSSTPGTIGGAAGSSAILATDFTAKDMILELRDILFSSSGSGAINSLSRLGLNTGAIGSAVGTTDRLQLDANQLTNALNQDAGQVASLLDSASGPLSALLARLKTLQDPSSKTSWIQANTKGLADEISQLQDAEQNQQDLIDNYTRMVEAQYTAMEATLAQLQAQSAQIAAQLGYSTNSSGSGLSRSSTS
jgi:flagellar hook-associated protein 2